MTSYLTDPRTPAEHLADLLLHPRLIALNDRGHVIGQGHHRAKLTDHDVWLMFQLRGQGMTCKDIAGKFDVSLDTVKSISMGRRRGQTTSGQRG